MHKTSYRWTGLPNKLVTGRWIPKSIPYTITDRWHETSSYVRSSSEVTKYIVEQDLANLDGALNAAKSADLVVIMADLLPLEALTTANHATITLQMVAVIDANPNAVVVMKTQALSFML